MSSVTRIGPRDQGREMTYDEFLAGDYEEGSKYELIEGRLCVRPHANYPHDWVLEHIHHVITLYKLTHPNVVKRVSMGARVFVPRRRRTACPEPDFAIYSECLPGRNVEWREISPLIVVEVVSASDPEKDLIRNVALYREVPSIREYWLFERCDDVAEGPTLRVYNRPTGDDDWSISEYDRQAVYTTPLLPGLELPVAPSDA